MIPAGIPKRTLGWGVIHWASKYLRQPDGDNAGKPWAFTDSQARFVLWLYEVNEAGKFTYTRAVQRLAKGSGKSPFVAALCLAELCGPVRFSHFDSEGMAVGKPQAMPWVQIAAVSKDQTRNTMTMVLAMCPKGSRIQNEFKLDVGKEIIYTSAGGRLEIITSAAHTAEGNRPTFTVADEVEWWLPSNGGHDLFDTLRRNLGKTSGRMLETCNAYVPGQNSIAEETDSSQKLMSEGKTRRNTILYDAIEAPADTKLDDEDSLREGLRVAYRDATWVDIDRVITEIWDPSTPPDVARRFYLNQIVAASDSWIAPHEWDQCEKKDRLVEDGEKIVLFFDGSRKSDATALIGCCLSDGHIFEAGVWEPALDGEINVEVVDARVKAAFERWDVKAMFCDVQEWQGHVIDAWPQELPSPMVWAEPSKKPPQPFAWDMRTKIYDFTSAAEACHTEIVEHRLTHDGSPAVRRHIVNARRRENRYGISVGKEAPHSPKKIDAAVCVIGARMVRRIVLGSKEFQKADRKPAKAWVSF